MKFLRESIARKSATQAAPEESVEGAQENLVDAAQAAMDAIRTESANQTQAAAEPLPALILPEPISISPEPISPEPVAEQPGNDTRVETAPAAVAPVAETPAGVNIWDMGNEAESEPAPLTKTEEISSPPRPRHRARRNKTRILGFESQDTSVNDLFETDEKPVAATTNIISMNPTGWLIVVSGPGRGASFPLFTGMSQIGRGADQAISLDFGDTAISRANHASIAYDPTEHKFYFGHGGKSNLVRLNGKPVLSTEVTKDGDQFTVGETTLRLRTLCGPDFNWETSGSEDDEHVAIA